MFNVFISSFIAEDEDDEERRNYFAEVVPWFWFLTRTADCRIFQKQNVVTILETIFDDLGFADLYDTSQISGNHPEREYCVQYRETDFAFACRLMEEEGIYYYFKHENGKHTMVLADNKGAYQDCLESEVDFPPTHGPTAVTDHITAWQHQYQFRTGKWAQTDYNFKTPSTRLMTRVDTVVDLPGTDAYEVYDYPGVYAESGDGEALTRIRMEEEEAGYDRVDGASTCKSFAPGGKFKIGVHRSRSEQGKSYVLTAVTHSATEPMSYETGGQVSEDYSNSFECIPDAVVFRPQRTTPRPQMKGAQTAIVVGPAGEEIYPDEHGRVKVQFHWDREGQYDENSSCWIRVSQLHAGKGFGAISLPRIGEEVIVSFLEGDPDRPIITGRVYHAENQPPYGLPDAKNISGMKSNSTKGGGGYNEYVMDDTQGNELIREHAQFDKDSTIENDLREHVLNNRSRDVSVDETVSVGSNQSITVGSDRSVAVGANQDVSVGSNQSINVGSNQDTSVAANDSVTIGANQSISVSSNQDITVGANRAASVGGNEEVTVSGSATISATGPIEIKSAAKITIGVGGSSITITAAGIEIAGPMITASAQGVNTITGALVKIN